MWRNFVFGLIVALLLTGCQRAQAPAQSTVTQPELTLVTTTTTDDSGLMSYLLPLFTAEQGIQVKVIVVGSGQALKIGEKGDADVLLVHARQDEEAFMAAGHGIRREDVMYNDFVLVGPATDPAQVQSSQTSSEAFTKIAQQRAPFISRGDDSGTHRKELKIWELAGIAPAGDWYVAAGQGMGAVLTIANERQAYTLSDRATFLARSKEGSELTLLFAGDPLLRNPYGAIAVNPAKNPNIRNDLANRFIEWLIAVPTQAKIAEFGKQEFGQSLFVPDSRLWQKR